MLTLILLGVLCIVGVFGLGYGVYEKVNHRPADMFITLGIVAFVAAGIIFYLIMKNPLIIG